MATSNRNIILSLVAAFIVITITVALAEGALRVFTPDWLALRMLELNAGSNYDPGSDRGWPQVQADGKFKSFLPGATFPIIHYEYQNKVTIDEFGGRAIEDERSSLLVPFLGDSFTFGVGVEDHQTFTSILANQHQGYFANLGVPGSALDNQIDIVRIRHRELGSPSLYVFNMFLGNDLSDLYGHEVSTATRKDEATKAASDKLLSRINGFVYHNRLLKKMYSIQFFRKYALAIAELGSQSHEKHMNPIYLAANIDSSFLKITSVYFHKELNRLVDLANELNFNFVFVLLPDIHQVNTDRAMSKAAFYGLDPDRLDMDAPNKMIKSALDEKSVRYFDVTNCLRTQNRIDDLYYVQDNHLTSTGHQAVADCLIKEGLLVYLGGKLNRNGGAVSP